MSSQDFPAGGLPAVPLEPLMDRDPTEVGPFRLLGRLGAGGMGVAYLTQRNRQWIVLKVVRPEVTENRATRARLAREIAAIDRVGSEWTAQVVDSDLESEQMWFAMEFIPGHTLSNSVESQGPMPSHELTRLALQLALVVQAIHAAGIVHRDLKPSNIMLSPTGPKIIDFGIADIVEGTQLTSTGSVMGSTGWLSPEQVKGDEASWATDVHAWGLTVLFAATGVAPYGAGTTAASMYKVLETSPTIPDSLPEPLRGLVASALEKDPLRRPTIDRILSELEETGQGMEPLEIEIEEDDYDPIGNVPDLAAALVTPSKSTARNSTMSIVALGLSIFGFACGVSVIPSLILGIMARKRDRLDGLKSWYAIAAIRISILWLAAWVGLMVSAASERVGIFFLFVGAAGSILAAVANHRRDTRSARLWPILVSLGVSLLLLVIGFATLGTPWSSKAASNVTAPPSSPAPSIQPSVSTDPADYSVSVDYSSSSIPDQDFANTLTWTADLCADSPLLLQPSYSNRIALEHLQNGEWLPVPVNATTSSGGRCEGKSVNVFIGTVEAPGIESNSSAGCEKYRVLFPETPEFKATEVPMCVSVRSSATPKPSQGSIS